MSSISSPSWAAVAATYAELNTLYVAVSAANAAAPIPAEARAGNRTHLAVVRSWLDRLGPTGDLGIGIVSGKVSLEKWVAIANVQGAALNTITRTFEEENAVGRFWREVVLQTGQDVAVVVKDAAGGVGFGAGAAAVVVAALYFGLLGGRR